MSNTPTSTGCWTKCLWCITTCGGRRISRVTPSDPIQVVSAKCKNGTDLARIPNTSPSHAQSDDVAVSKSGLGNGNINHFLVSNDSTDGSSRREGPVVDGDAYENVPGDEDGNCEVRRVSVEIDDDVHLKNSIFIEVGKERRIRVVHLKELSPVEVREDQLSPKGATEVASCSSSEPSPANEVKKPEEEEEDEYWFSKWTRKPRFRSIFEKNTIHCGAPADDDDETENNNTVNGGGGLSKDFEMARAAAAAKRRAWAYNNGNCDNVVEPSTVIQTEDEEFNSIDICETGGTRWTKSGGNDNVDRSTGDESSSVSSEFQQKIHQVEVDVQNHPLNSKSSTTLADIAEGENGFTNLGFEDNEERSPEIEPSKTSPLHDETNTSIGSPKPKVNNVGIVSDDSLTVIPLDDPEPLQTASGSMKLPLIFFIHGISGSSEVWKSQMDFFHNLGYEIVAPDLLGHGFSSTPYNVKYYFFESLAQDLLSVFDYFVQEGRKVVLIGHGYGACLASVITRVRPKSSCLLISIAGGGPTPLISRTCCRSSLVPFYCKLFHTNKKKGRFDNPEIRHVLPPTVYEYILTGQVWNDGDSAFYRRITVPTLLVYGMKDKVVNLVEECEMERTIPKSFLEIIDTAGHMVMFDDSVKLNKMLGKFIQSWS